ncbi:phosphoribosylformylglycinamidine cyclo-ligase [Bacteroidota bacterium]
MKITYKSSGVNIPKSEEFISRIKPLVKKTFSKNVLSGIGNFGAFFELDLKKYKKPVFISSIDGVGTKIKIASAMNKFNTIGEDLVNHCVNDIAVCGAVPLFFMDYYATGKLDSNSAVNIVKGLVKACKENSCSLIGGETAEMPGIYSRNDFDLAGAIFGVVDKHKIVKTDRVRKGDVLIGLVSNGIHTNGYSLIRKIFDSKHKLQKYYTELRCRLGNELLKVHKSYLKIIQSSLMTFNVKSISHVTGGGIEGNTKRVIPAARKLSIDWKSWERPAIFDIIKTVGSVPEPDMRKTFNLGIGLVFIISKNEVDRFRHHLKRKKEKNIIIGDIL